MRVIADIDEADIGGVKEGQRVQFSVDAYPDETFEGSVTQVRQQATTESNVVTYEVVIGAPNKDLKLKPGLTANVTIYTNHKSDVLIVPNKALKFTPNPMFLGPDGKIQDTQAAKKVWTKQGNTFTAHKVETGITNGSVTEIISGVKEGTKVVTELNLTGVPTEAAGSGNPFMPGPPGRRNNSSSNNSSNNSSRN
jgi:HlyD family secretion protein